MKSLREELGLSADQVRIGLALLEKPRTVRRRGQTFKEESLITRDEHGRIFLRELYRAERDIATNIRRLQAAELDELTLPEGAFNGKTPDPSQVEALRTACQSNVVVLTGGPGTGKTTISRAIIASYEAAGLQVVCCAPTGKAAIRMKQQTDRDAATVHNTIGLVPGGEPRHDDGPAVYNTKTGDYIRGGPIEASAVILDETSMVDVTLMAQLIRAIPTGARLLIVGDVDQLPSIGPGRVLFDLIASQAVPMVRLTKIHRQADVSRIPYVARDINRGQVPADLHKVGTDFTHWECRQETRDSLQWSPEQVAAERIIRSLADPEASITSRKGIPVTEIQVLSSQYKGPVGVLELNAQLQERLNPAPNGDHNGDIFVGRGYSIRTSDRVIHTRNNYDLLVMNGEMGYVVASNPDGVELATFEQDGDFSVLWSGKVLSAEDAPRQDDENDGADLSADFGDPWGDADAEVDALEATLQKFGGLKIIENDAGDRKVVWAEPRVVVVDFGDRKVAYTRSEARELELGYAITVHKSQGSQFKAVVMALHASNPRMLTRALLYTAITRAEAFCLTVGCQDQIARAARNTHGSERRTVLQERLAKAVVPGSSSLKSLTLG